MIEPIKFPDPCSTEMKADITAGKVNEIVEWINAHSVPSIEQVLADQPKECEHNLYRLNKYSERCKKCGKVIKNPL